MSSSASQLPKAKKTKKDRKNLKKAQDEANAVYDSLSNGQTDILSKFSSEHILGMRLSNYDRNLLHIAVWFNVEALIDKLCSNSAFKSLINDKDANGETPLHISVFCQNVEAYRKLLTAGANLEITNNKGERPLDTARDPVLWQNYQNQNQVGISPSIIKSDQVEKTEEIKNPEPQAQTQPQAQAQQSPQQEQPRFQPVVVQQPEIKKNEDKNKPIENKSDKSVEKNTLEVQLMDSKEMPPSPNFGALNQDVAKKSQPEISTPILHKTQEQKDENEITPFVEKEVRKIDENKNSMEIKKPLSDNKVTPISQEIDIPVIKNQDSKKDDNKIPISQEKKSQDLKVTPILPQKEDSKDNKNTRISQEKQDIKIPTQNDSKKDPQNPLVLPQDKNKQDLKMPLQNDSKKDHQNTQEKIISTIPTNNQNKDSKVPVPKDEKITNINHSNPLNLVVSPKTNGDTVPQPQKNTTQKDVVPRQENPIKKIESNNTNPMSISPIPQKNLNDSLVNHGTTSRETQPKTIKKPENNNDINLIETFAKPQNPTSIPSKNETTPSPTKRNPSRTNLNLNNNSPKLVDKKKNDRGSESNIPDILDKTKMPALNLQPTPIKTQQKRENSKETIRKSSSRLNDSSLPSVKKDNRGGSKTPFRTNAREIIGSNNPSSLTFETNSPIKVESKRDLSRHKISSKSILDSKLNLIDEKSPAKRENSSLMNKRPNMMMSYKGSGANLQLDISRKTKEDYKADNKGYKIGSRIDSSPLDSNSSPGLGFNDRRLSNIMHVHSKYINDTAGSLKLLDQRNRSVEKVISKEAIFEYSNHSQANIRTKTENYKEWDSIFDISMHTEGDKSFSSPFRPGRMLYMNPTENMKPKSPEKKDRTLSSIRDKDPEYSFGRPLVPKEDFIFGRQKSPTGKREDSSPSPLRKAELIYVTNSDYNFTTQGSDAPLNANRRFKRDTWKGGNFG